MVAPEQCVKIAIAESEQLKEYLGSLPSEAWNKPSACARWEVRDVVAHLGSMAEAYIERIHESLAQKAEPNPGIITAAALADGNAQRAISRRESLGGSGEQVLSDFVSKNDALNQLMATLGPTDWELYRARDEMKL